MNRLALLATIFITVTIFSCSSSTTTIPGKQNIRKSDTYTYKYLPFSFPEKIGALNRISVRESKDDPREVSVGYSRKVPGQSITFTVYLSSVAPTDAPDEDVIHTVYVDTRSSIDFFYTDVRVLSEQLANFKSSIPGRKTILQYRDPESRIESISEIHLFKINNTIVKYRISYPPNQREALSGYVAAAITDLESNYARN